MHDFLTKVVGVSFVAGYPENLYALRDVMDALPRKAMAVLGFEGLAVVLRRNPENRYDRNAIEVHVPALGDHGMIGHLPARDASRLAPRLDAGEVWQAEVTGVRIDPVHPDRPGIDVRAWQVDA